MKTKIEKRTCKVSLRAADGEDRKLTGMAIVYDKKSDDMGFVEIVKRGAATSALKKSDIRALYGHNSDSLLPLGRTSAGTLRAKETKAGVEIEIDPPDTQFARDLMTSIDRGDIQDMSFAFSVKDDIWETKDGKDIRTITKIDELFDVSFVSYPAYPDTTVALRNLEQHRNNAVTGDKNSVIAENEDIDIDLLTLRTRRFLK